MSFKRGVPVKAALNIGQPDYFQEFWEINNQGFYDTGKLKDNYISCAWVIPVYVFSINEHWNGDLYFDICPVDFSKSENGNERWGWKAEKSRKDIGLNIFYTEKEAWEKWRELYKSNPKDPLRGGSRESIMRRRKRHMEIKNKVCVG